MMPSHIQESLLLILVFSVSSFSSVSLLSSLVIINFELIFSIMLSLTFPHTKFDFTLYSLSFDLVIEI